MVLKVMVTSADTVRQYTPVTWEEQSNSAKIALNTVFQKKDMYVIYVEWDGSGLDLPTEWHPQTHPILLQIYGQEHDTSHCPKNRRILFETWMQAQSEGQQHQQLLEGQRCRKRQRQTIYHERPNLGHCQSHQQWDSGQNCKCFCQKLSPT